jgi:hypothetical protein
MAMTSSTLLVATALATLNVLLLGVVGAVWLRNYRTFRTPLVLGLLAFAAVLLVENLVALYFFLDMRMLYVADPDVHLAVAILRALQFVALALLTYVTLK